MEKTISCGGTLSGRRPETVEWVAEAVWRASEAAERASELTGWGFEIIEWASDEAGRAAVKPTGPVPKSTKSRVLETWYEVLFVQDPPIFDLSG